MNPYLVEHEQESEVDAGCFRAEPLPCHLAGLRSYLIVADSAANRASYESRRPAGWTG